MIPKIIHFAWVPGFDKAPEYSSINIQKWRDLNPDYEIKIWDEKDAIDLIPQSRINSYRHLGGSFIKRSDFIRIEILLNYGGYYFDSDIEPKKSLDYFLNKKRIESPKMENDRQISFIKKKVDLRSKSLVFSREWKNPLVKVGSFFPNRHRIANGIIFSEKENPLLEEFLDLNCKKTKNKVLQYLGPHALTFFFLRKSRIINTDQLCIIPPQHFLWEDSVGKQPKWSVSKHMGKNTWGDHSKYDYWNV